MNPELSLSQIFNEAEAIARDVQSTFGHLNAEQLNWKPSAEQWSVGQCLDHLVAANGQMLSAFDPIISGTKQTTFIERLPFWPSLWGRMMVKIVSPQGTRKFKAPPGAAPSSSKLDPQIVRKFADLQQEVSRKIKAVENMNPDKIIITSPFAGFITYSLLDTCRIIVAHERRHIAQAERVMAMNGFPK